MLFSLGLENKYLKVCKEINATWEYIDKKREEAKYKSFNNIL